MTAITRELTDTSLHGLLGAHAKAEARQARIKRLRDRAMRLAIRRAEVRALAETDPLIDMLIADRVAPRAVSRAAPLPPGFADFRRAMSLLHRAGEADRPVAARTIAANLSPGDAARINALQAATAREAETLAEIEQEALLTPPSSAPEATSKLRFLSSLMLSGGSVEVDYFAWLVDECASVIQEAG